MSNKQRRVVGSKKSIEHEIYVVEDEVGSMPLPSASRSIDSFLDELQDRKKIVRETALSFMVEAFTNKIQSRFADKKFATVLYSCLHLLKNGSSKESLSTSRLIGLLALTVTCKKEDDAHEIYEESLLKISLVLESKKSRTELLSSVLDCLATVTFHGVQNSEENEKSMQIIWDFIHSVHYSKTVARKKTPEVLAAAISAWSFLLSTMQSWNISCKIWQGAISYFSSLLEHENKSVHVAAVEALVLIVELKCLKKFSTHEAGQDAKGKLIEEVKSVLVKANNEYMFKEDGCEDPTIEDYEDNKCDTMSNANFSDDHITSACNSAIWDVLNVSEDSNNARTSVEVGDFTLSLKWSQLIQLKFLKRFLGDGFIHHMQNNKILHSVFEYSPNRRVVLAPWDEQDFRDCEKATVEFYQLKLRHQKGHKNNKILHSVFEYSPNRRVVLAPWDEQDFRDSEKATVEFYQPKLRHQKGHKRVYKSPNSVSSKARSKLLKRERMQSEARNYQSMCD